MERFNIIFKGLLLAAVLGGASACDEKRAPSADPEAEHCTRAAKRLTRAEGSIAVIEAKSWTTEDVRNVRVRFAYPETVTGSTNGSLICTYPFPLAVRGDKNRHPQAQSMFFQARYLSQNELLLLNIGLRGTDQ